MAVPYQRRRSVVSSLVVPGIILVVGGLLVYGLLRIRNREPGPKPPPPGTAAIIVSPHSIPIYTQVTKEILADPRTGHFRLVYVDPALITSDMRTSLQQVTGRVLNHDKPAGYAFTEADFYPRGTRPGPTAGVPPGKRMFRAVADKISGLVGLNPGDHFDLMATIPVDAHSFETLPLGRAYTDTLKLRMGLTNAGKQATGRVIVQDGVVVLPLSTRAVPTVTQGTLMSAPVQRTRPIQEVVIAVAPQEVGPLMEALAVGADLTCNARSGRADDIPTIEPDHIPVNPFGPGGGFPPMGIIETITGEERAHLAAPKESSGGSE